MPTRFPGGISTAARFSELHDMFLPDPTRAHVWFKDFDSYAAGDWVISTTEAGTGSATEALQNADGGVLKLTNAEGDDDLDFLQWAGGSGAVKETFLVEAGKQMWFKARMKVSDATQSDFVMGLQIGDTTPLSVTDGIYFQKNDGDANLDFHVVKNTTLTSATAISTIADDTYTVMGFYYDGVSEVKYYVDGVHVGTASTTNLPDDEELTISFGVQNGEAAVKTMSIDYIYAAKER